MTVNLKSVLYQIPFLNEINFTFPHLEHLVLSSYHFNLAGYDCALFVQFNIFLPEKINSSILKRQAEYLAGRYAARMALSKLDIEIDRISTGKHREPIWPERISASITHTDNIAICAASYKDNYEFLGIDLEKILNEKYITEIKALIITIEEENLLLKTNLNFEDAFSLTFSAKESLFKALYPSVRAYFNFSAANIIDICCDKNCFTLVLQEDLTAKLTAGTIFTGHFLFDKNHIFTIISQ